MDKPVIIIEAPELNDQGVAHVRAFLHEIILAFESHYYHRLRRYHCRLPLPDELKKEEVGN